MDGLLNIGAGAIYGLVLIAVISYYERQKKLRILPNRILGSPLDAIDYALELRQIGLGGSGDDSVDFLRDWHHGDINAWPGYRIRLDVKYG